VLLKSLPADIHAEPVPMAFCRATEEEVERFFSRSKKDLEERRELTQRLVYRMKTTCGEGIIPAC
jgi:hypothetical protein